MSADKEMTPAQQPSSAPDPALKPNGGYPPPYYGQYHAGGRPYGGIYGGNPSEGLPFIGALTLERLLRVITRRWFTLFIGIAFGLSVGLFALTRMTPMYRAMSLIEMNLRQPRVMTGSGAVADDGSGSPQAAFDTRLEKLYGSAVHALAEERFRGLWTGEKQAHPLALPASGLGNRVSFKVRQFTQLVEVIFEHSDREFAAAAANAFAEAAQLNTTEENKRTSDSAVAWLQEQASAQSVKLADAEQKLIDFRVKNGIDTLQGEKHAAEGSQLALQAALVDLQKETVLTREVLACLEKLALNPEQAGSLPAGLPREDAILAALNARRDLESERILMTRRLTDNHPDMIVQKEKVGYATANLNAEIEMAKSAVSNKVALLNRQAEGVGRKANELKKSISDLDLQIGERTTRLSAMERERDALSTAYKGLLSRIEEARLSADESAAIVKILERAAPPATPIWPPRTRIMMAGLILGLLGGLGLALVTDNLEDRVTGFGDVENYIGVKLLGIVPHVASASRADLALATLNHKFSQLSEAFAGVRAALNVVQVRAAKPCTLVTSAAPGEGKTITSCNLAIASAKTGRKTLLIDFDMRRPRLHGIFKRPGERQSLLHVLNSGDHSRFDDLPLATQCEHLDIVTSLPADDISPAEVLGGDIVKEFIAWTKEKYERIVIDSPPYGVVSDAAALADCVDGVVLVCRPDKSRRRATRNAVRQFMELGAHVYGCIVNDVDFRRSGYFSNYDYRGSSYSYDYAHDGDDKKRLSRRERSANARKGEGDEGDDATRSASADAAPDNPPARAARNGQAAEV